MRKGLTLVEIVVAMAIFLIVITVAVGAFVTIGRMKALTSTMKDSQQKTRIAMEMITRLSRQAEIVSIPNATELVLYFDLKGTPSASRFTIEPRCTDCEKTLYYYECPAENITTGPDCSNWADKRDLYTGINLLTSPEIGRDSGFIKIGSYPPKLTVNLYGKIGDLTTNTYYSDEINLNTTIILEGVK